MNTPTYKPVNTDKRLMSLEAGRGLAAMAVALMHTATGMAPVQYSGEVGFNGLLNFGRFGVDFFFVLSGFIIYLVHKDWSSKPLLVPAFVTRRIFRIIPAYIVVLLLAATISQFQRDKVTLSLSWLVGQTTLAAIPPWIGPAWTLQFELAFYGVFCAYILNRSIGVLTALAWICAIVVYPSPHSGHPTEWSMLIRDPHITLFALGIALAIAYERGLMVVAAVTLSSLALGVYLVDNFLLGDTLEKYAVIERLWIGAVISAILSAALALEHKGVQPPDSLVKLGGLSYALYIIHVPVVGYSFAALNWLGIYKSLPQAILLVIAVAISTFAAFLLHVTVERSFIEIGKRLEMRIRAKTKSAA